MFTSNTLDLSSFDTSNVTNMSSICSLVLKQPTLDLSSFDTSNVTNMGYMFNGSQATLVTPELKAKTHNSTSSS